MAKSISPPDSFRRKAMLKNKFSFRKVKKIDSLSTMDETQTVGFDSMEDPFVMRKLREAEVINKNLQAKCSKLEAEVVISAAEKLDILARLIGWSLTILCLVLYFFFADLGLKLVDKHYSHRMPLFTVLLPLIKTVFYMIPYVHHRQYYGRFHRRFQTFAVAFVFMVRIKLTRHRIRIFLSNESQISADKEDSDEASYKSEGDQSEFEVGKINADDLWESTNEVNARFLYASIFRLRGALVKTAQYLSSRADFVPKPFVRELSKLQESAPESEWSHVHGLLKKDKSLDYFQTIDKKPVASASIGQVHMATLKSEFGGTKVVIKAIHPHSRTLLSDDMKTLKTIAYIIGVLETEYKFLEILMKEWAKETLQELDFKKEADNLTSAQAAIDKMRPVNLRTQYGNKVKTTNSYPTSSPENIPFDVEIPHPIKDLCSSDVLVMSYSEGERIDNFEQIKKCNVPKIAVMDAVSQTFAHMMYVGDIFNGDPHPGNIFIRPGTEKHPEGFTIALLDWGLVKRLPDEKRIAFCQMTYAAATVDFGLMMDGFDAVGLKLKRENVAEDMEGLRFILRDMVPSTKGRKRLQAKLNTDSKRMITKKKGARVPVDSKAYPGEFFFFIRVNELLHGLGSKLSVEFSYVDAIKMYAQRGLSLSKNDGVGTRRVAFDKIKSERFTDDTLNKKIDKILDEMAFKDEIAGAQVCVIDSDGDTIAHTVKGHMGSLKRNLPMRSDTLLLGFSVTKAITATLAHLMVQLGYLTYDEPICERVWKEFCPQPNPPKSLLKTHEGGFLSTDLKTKWEWKRNITLRHILTHTSGMWSALPDNLTIKKLSSCELSCKGFEYDPENPESVLLPSTEPGSKCIYHFMSFGWLVAGTLRGAYTCKHEDEENVTFEDVYEALLRPRLSSETVSAGFRPCGGSGGYDMALVDSDDLDLSKIVQAEREAKAMGESSEQTIETNFGKDYLWYELRESIRDKEFVLDSRIWNSKQGLNANVPAAGGRFTAKGLASFYHEVGTGKILEHAVLDKAIEIAQTENRSQRLHSPNAFLSSGGNNKHAFGLGYQIMNCSESPGDDFFGHAGVGGSIGLFHKKSKTSIAIMFNKNMSEPDGSKKIINAVASHLGWNTKVRFEI